jgi:hypothetical protein
MALVNVRCRLGRVARGLAGTNTSYAGCIYSSLGKMSTEKFASHRLLTKLAPRTKISEAAQTFGAKIYRQKWHLPTNEPI